VASKRAGLFDGDGWYERVASAVAPLLPERERLDLRAQYVVRDRDTRRRWVQVFANGRLQELRAGEVTDPDLVIEWDAGGALDVLGGRVSGTEALAVTTVATATPSGAYRGAPPPLDIVGRPELEELPKMPDASVTVQHHLRGGPFGDVDCYQLFVDGRLDRVELGALPEPDVEVEVPYRAHVRLRQGEIAALDALQEGRIAGAMGSLALYAGLLESEPFQRAQRACAHETGLVLATLGDINGTPGYREAVAAVTLAMEEA
jgi:hypothetical protein